MPPRQYAPKPLGPIETAIAGMTAKERANYKANQLKNLNLVGQSFTLDGITVTLLGNPTLFPYDTTGQGLEVNVSITKNGQPVDLGDPTYRFVNPPVKVPNGTYRVENGMEVPNAEENLVEAMKRILVDAIKTHAASKGVTL